MENSNSNDHPMITRSKVIQSKKDACTQTDMSLLENDNKRKYEEDIHLSNKRLKDNNVLILYTPPSNDDEEEEEEEYYSTEDDSESETDDSDRTNPRAIKEYKLKLNRKEYNYFNGLPDQEKMKMIANEDNISKKNENEVPIRFKILNSKMDDYTKSVAISKLDIVSKMGCSNGESMKIMNWVNNLCRIPIGQYTSLNIHNDKEIVYRFLESTSNDFNKKVYGHTDAKEQIIRILAQWISNPKSKGNVIGIHGNPGVGKTTLVKDCICKSLNLPFQFIPLGGASDGSYLDGHSFTYEGSTWGKIVDCLMKSKCMNPVLYFDELDKVSNTTRGQEIINILIHLTDPSQNATFYDKYFGDIPIDLSKCLIIFTYNNDHVLNPILKDRMIRIHTNDYSLYDKIEITKNFLIPEFNQQFNFKEDDLIFSNDIIAYIIQKTDKESGVRNLKRSLEVIFSNINLTRMIKTKTYDGPIGKMFCIHESTDSILPITLTNMIVDTYIKTVVVNESHHHLYM